MKLQREVFRWKRGSGAEHAKAQDVTSHGRVLLPSVRKPAEAAQFRDRGVCVQAVLPRIIERQELLVTAKMAKSGKGPFKFGVDQLSFIARFADHLIHVLEQLAINAVPTQKVFLLMGEGGAGKSEVVKVLTSLVDEFRVDLTRLANGDAAEVPGNTCVLMAQTNAAASNIGGDTIHSCMAFGDDLNYDIEKLAKKPVTQESITFWGDVYLLITDEISMVSPALLAAFSFRLNQYRSGDKWKAKDTEFTMPGGAFGRIPLVILAGDFMQLPAFEGFHKVSLLGKVSQAEPHAPRPGDPEAARKEKARQRREVFVVQGQALFAKAVTDVHILRKTFRFKDDVLPRFLTHMRNG